MIKSRSENRGAYRVRYLFVICGFSLAETNLISLARRSLGGGGSWVEPLKATIWNLFDTAPNRHAKVT